MPRTPIDRTPLRSFPKTIEADVYNCARLALRRLPHPLRFSLPEHRGLDAILYDDLWLVVNRFNGDEPVLTWTGFARPHNALHEPVVCELRLYHMHAGLVMGSALDALAAGLKTL